jgi:N-acetylneuraminate epimerase
MRFTPTTNVDETDADAERLRWDQLPVIPDPEGFGAAFAGTSGGALLVAGGANFPGPRPWAGGMKAWHDGVFVLERPDGHWTNGFRLPRPAAYGVSVTSGEGVICIGGGDPSRHFDDVLRLRWSRGRLTLSSLPRLPKPCAYMCGAVVNGTIYLAGGIETPDATACLNSFWAFDLNNPASAWRELEPCPGPQRMLAVAGAANGSFFLFSGARLATDAEGRPVREYLRDAWRYRPGSGWQRLADLPRAAVGAPSPAPRMNRRHLLVISGDDGSRIGHTPQDQHPGFPHSILEYDAVADAWTAVGDAPISRATAPTTEWRGLSVILNGEVVPGYRSPSVWTLEPAPEEQAARPGQAFQWAMPADYA